MTVDKIQTLGDAIADIPDGARILVGGFGDSGSPVKLLNALARRGLRDLTIVSNNTGAGSEGLAALFLAGSISRVLCSYPKSAGSFAFDELYAAGMVDLELIPQGTLSERIRAGGAGIGGFYTRTGAGTALTEGREHRELQGQVYVFEEPIRADFALLHAAKADRWGNLVFTKAARNFAPTMAMAADTVIVEADAVVPLGDLDPEQIVTPGVFVDRVVELSR